MALLPLPPATPSSPKRGWWRRWWLSHRPILAAVISRREVPAEHQRVARLLSRTWDGLVAFLLSVAAQVPLGAFQFMMRSEGSTFPASICAMLSVYVVLALLDKCRPGLGLDRFYTLHLGPAADLLNRHMSIGFTAPFVMMCRNPLPSNGAIGLIIACFVVTGIVNAVFAFVVAYTFHTALSGWLQSPRYASWKCEAKRLLDRWPLRRPMRGGGGVGGDGKHLGVQSQGDKGDFAMTLSGRPRSRRIQSWFDSTSSASFQPVTPEDGVNGKAAGCARVPVEANLATTAFEINNMSSSAASGPVGRRDPEPEHGEMEASTKHMIGARNLDGRDLDIRGEEGGAGQDRSWRRILFDLLVTHPITIFCWTVTILVGLPVLVSTGNGLVFSTFLLFAVWLSTLAAQASIKGDALEANADAAHHPGPSATTTTTTTTASSATRILLAGLTNPVLITSLAMIAYVYATASATSQPIGAVLDAFQYNITVPQALGILSYTTTTTTTATSNSSIVAQGRQGPPPMAAGDIAIAVLNAGLVAWGLKLFQYRRHLFSPAGVATMLSAAAMAVGNFFLGPKLALGMGLGTGGEGQPAVDQAQPLAFAARSVTLALGTPAMTALGGDAGLNAAMVVVSGIVYQMGLGLGVGRWLERLVRAVEARFQRCRQPRSADEEKAIGGAETADVGSRNWADKTGQQGGAQIDLAGMEKGILLPYQRVLLLKADHHAHQLQHHQFDSADTTAANSARPSQDMGNINITTDVDILTAPQHPMSPGADAIDNISTITIAACPTPPTSRRQQQQQQQQQQHKDHSPSIPSTTSAPQADPSSALLPAPAVDALTVAAGTTVGCNSAAMGTAYLYETRSEAAPYSALSMVMLGMVTVALAFAGPTAGGLQGWLAS